MILSRACQYGIQALLYLNARPPNTFLPVKQIAGDAGIPVAFLAKILGRLVAHGLLASMKGPRGGVQLARPTREITILDVVEAVDGLAGFKECVLGYPECNTSSPCPVHARWGPLREEIYDMLAGKNLEELARERDEGAEATRPRKRRRGAVTTSGKTRKRG